MSKAFTKEDAVDEPVATRTVVRLRPGEARYITLEGYAHLSRELAHLEALPRAQVLPSSDVAQRLVQLQALVAALTPVSPVDGRGRVVFGAWVELEDEDGASVTYRLVGPDESDARSRLISIDSPLARALVGKHVGELVQVVLPRGARDFKVMNVRYAAHG